jgi:hypothetical protein
MEVSRFFNHDCHRCGVCDEYKFSVSGKHIKASCNGCGAYVEFIKQSKIPSVLEIKEKIFVMVDRDIQKIKNVKQEIGFIENREGMATEFCSRKQLEYWKLYLHLKK